MLYAMQDATRRALAPLAQLADIGSWFTAHTSSFFVPEAVQRQTQANLKLLKRLTKSYDKPKFNINEVQVGGTAVAVTDVVVVKKPFCNLVHFAKAAESRGPRLLIVAPLSGHHATLLRATVQALLEDHDVYITDWTDARQVSLAHGEFGLSDYTAYVQDFIRFLGADAHVLAVCQPSVPTLAAVSLMAQNGEALAPKSLTLIAGPVDTSQSPTAVNRFATERDINYFKNQLIERVPAGYPGVMRKVYPGFKQLTGFVMMNRDKHAEAYAAYHRAVSTGDEGAANRHEAFYDEYNAVLDMPAEYYLETIEKIFLSPQLARGELDLCGQRVDPTAIRRTALLTIEGDQDDITGAGQTHAAQALCGRLAKSKRKTLTVKGVGHYGAFAGSTFKAHTVPVIREFIRKHS
jgi:poly(3-hydroxybutyrate) depolymerase